MKKGFTLIELLTVIAIIGILATVITVSTNKAREQSRDAKRKSDLSAISAAIEMYYAQIRSYPANLTILTNVNNQFISSIPKDPKGTDYIYILDSPTNPKKYVLDAVLESTGNEEFTCPLSTTDSNYYKTGVCCDNTIKNCHYRVTNK